MSALYLLTLYFDGSTTFTDYDKFCKYIGTSKKVEYGDKFHF